MANSMTQAHSPSYLFHEYRYERKFLVTGLDTRQLATMIRLHPMAFSTAYPDRPVNNIYFDTEDFQYFRDNVEGVSNRKKIRIRWYGNWEDTEVLPVLEYKIKRGPVGYKKNYRLAPVQINPAKFDVAAVVDQMLDCDLPDIVRLDLAGHRPVLVNSYHRMYNLSHDRRFRLTIDNEMTYYRVMAASGTLRFRDTDHHSTVIELKYPMENDKDAKSVTNAFPFRMTKNSKYVSGINRVYGGNTY